MNPLDQLNDIAVPASVNAWPLAWGWWVVISVALLIVVLTVVAIARRLRAYAATREALTLLTREYENGGLNLGYANQLMKRLLLSYTERTQVSALSGDTWVNVLAAAVKQSQRKQAWTQELSVFAVGPYQAPNTNPEYDDAAAIYQLTQKWLKAVTPRSLQQATQEVDNV